MIVLDENFPDDQRNILHSWRIHTRKIGDELGRSGMKDDELVPFLMQLTRPTFLTLDFGWYGSRLAHPRYCIVLIEARRVHVATLARRTIQHPELNTQAKRTGKVIRVHYTGFSCWSVGQLQEAHYTFGRKTHSAPRLTSVFEHSALLRRFLSDSTSPETLLPVWPYIVAGLDGLALKSDEFSGTIPTCKGRMAEFEVEFQFEFEVDSTGREAWTLTS